MPQRVDKHYNDFGGLDTTTNALKMDPRTQRRGSKNWRYNYDDQYTQRYGFQHKTENIVGFEFGIAEYKFRDLNTGEAKTEILGVGSDGFLYKRRSDRLKMVRSSGSVQFYSVYYNELIDQWTFTLFDSSMTVLFTVDFDETYTLNDLVSGIISAALTGFTASVVDENDAPAAGTAPAYLLQIAVATEFNTTGTDIEYNDAWWAEKILSPSADALFPEVLDATITGLADFEGLTYQNLNNSIYLTCGGFPIKYDGYSAYRAGVPEVLPQIGSNPLNASGIGASSATTTGGGLTAGDYRYRFKFGYIDSNGAEYLGDYGVGRYFTDLDFALSVLGGNNSVTLTYYGYRNDNRFPVYACRVDGAQNIATSGGTFNVDSGHNISAGMLLQIPIDNALIGASGYSFILSEVTGVTANTITVAQGRTSGIYPFATATTLLADNQILSAGFREAAFYNTITDIGTGVSAYHPQKIVGAFLRVYRTKVNQSAGPFYKVIDLPLPLGSMGAVTFVDRLADASINEEYDSQEGGPLPRACRYLGVWQNQLVQGGRPYNTSLKDQYYPSYFANVPLVNNWGEPSTNGRFYLNEETSLCDFQSIYWTDPLNLEAFPNSGLSEEDFQGKYADQIRGFAENKEALFVLKDRTVGLLTGTLATNDISKEILETDAGGVSHNSIQEVAGSLVWLDGVGGFWTCVAGRLPEYLGSLIQDDFRKNQQKPRNQRLLPSRAKATNFRLDSQYICFIPAGWIEDGETEANPNPTPYSLMFVYDFAVDTRRKPRNCWYQWQDVYPTAGILSTANDELIFSEFRDGQSKIWRQKRSGTRFDMTDNREAIDLNIKSAWLNYGVPTIDKDFVNFWISSIVGGFDIVMQQYYNYVDKVQSDYTISVPEITESSVAVKYNGSLNVPKISAVSIGLYHNEKNKLVTIDGFEIVYAADFDPGEPKK